MPKIGKLTEGFENVPEGNYTVQLAKDGVGDITTGAYGEIIRLTFEVTAPRKYRGKQFSDIFGWKDDSLSLGSKLYKILKAANGGVDLEGEEDLEDFEQRPFLASVIVKRKDGPNGPQEFNSIATAMAIPQDDEEDEPAPPPKRRGAPALVNNTIETEDDDDPFA